MSLNFDLRDVIKRLGEERYNELTTAPDTIGAPDGQQRWHAVTDLLIWSSLAVDLGGVTEGNVDEWCFRLGLLRIVGNREPDIAGGLGKFNLNRNDIVNHIGLRTNVATKNRAQWLARIFKSGSYDAEHVTRVAGMLPTQEPSAAEQINAAYAASVAAKGR